MRDARGPAAVRRAHAQVESTERTGDAVPGILGAMSRAVRYHVVNKIAHGGMAEIFLALQLGAEGFQKQVVLKRILPSLAADPSFVRMLVDEAHIASTLNHSNLVQVLDLGKSGDQFFLVLEFVDGWSLEQARRRAQKARMKFPLPLALYVVGSLCRALAYVHTRKRRGRPLGIVHRDVTPQNVLLSREGEVKLADFGIAKAIGKTEKSATGVIKGKFAYMSPEQSIGGELDARSDLFSVGTVLYLLATGRKPFEGATDLDVLMQVRKARYEKPSTLVRDFNPEVERFIARALRADRSRRWQSAEQMADRIDAILLKLGQTTGPSALKRWLDNLSAKDGARPPAEVAEQSSSSGTVELGSRDLELEEVAPSAEATVGPDEEEEVSTRAEGRRQPAPPPAPTASDADAHAHAHANDVKAGSVAPVYAAYGVEDGRAGTAVSAVSVQSASAVGAVMDQAVPEESGTPPPRPRVAAPVVGRSAPSPRSSVTRQAEPVTRAAAAPASVVPQARRGSPPTAGGLRRVALISVVAVASLGGSAYLARQYLFTRWLRPVKSWLQQRLPPPVQGPDWTGDPREPLPVRGEVPSGPLHAAPPTVPAARSSAARSSAAPRSP